MTKSKPLSDWQLFQKYMNPFGRLVNDTFNLLIKERDAQRVCANCKYHIKKDDSSRWVFDIKTDYL